VLNAAGGLTEDFRPPKGGFLDRRAHTVLTEAVQLLERIADHPEGLIQAIADGTFGITKRSPDGGKGRDGVFRTAAGAYNPALELMERVDA
jgi:beta-lysine 5,6-aminomutase alpha subunit